MLKCDTLENCALEAECLQGVFVCPEKDEGMARTAKPRIEEPLDENGLTAAQEAYCRARAAGSTPTDAARAAEPSSSYQTAYNRGKDYEDLEKVRNRIASLREQVTQNLITELEEIKADLTRIATDENRPDGVRLKAYDQLTRMIGGYRDKIEVAQTLGVQETEDKLTGLLDG